MIVNRGSSFVAMMVACLLVGCDPKGTILGFPSTPTPTPTPTVTPTPTPTVTPTPTPTVTPTPLPWSGFGANVIVIESTESIAVAQESINAIYNSMWESEAQFSESRYAILLQPGTYESLDVRVGYYTQVLGVGHQPDDVKIIGAVRTQDGAGTYQPPNNNGSPGALNNFWRAAENLSIVPTLGSIEGSGILDQDYWAVSQAAPLRRIHIESGSLRLFDSGWSSGGFMADILSESDIDPGSQQQWFSRNIEWEYRWWPSNWNMVFAGSDGVVCTAFAAGYVPTDCTFIVSNTGITESHPLLAIGTVPVISEKPYLTLESNGTYAIQVPDLKSNSNGCDFSSSRCAEHGQVGTTSIPVSQFFVANPTTSTESMNTMLAAGYNLLLTPGIYNLTDTIVVPNANQIVFSMGISSLVAPDNAPAMIIDDVDGVKLAGGIIFDANNDTNNTLLQVGLESGTNVSHESDPIELYDVYCRVGGYIAGSAASCMTINSNNVIGDNVWLWRADHGLPNTVGWTINRANNGLIVNGHNVTFYGLAVEHFEQYQTIWNGESGTVMFYQSEAPYDVPSESSWNPGTGESGYASYYVPSAVNHHAYGIGVYSNFTNDITLSNAILAPSAESGNFLQMLTVWLNGESSSSITHIFNGYGESANSESQGIPMYWQ